MKGLIIDLRGNPGGPLVSALDIASIFLPNRAILTQLSIDDGHRRIERFYSTNRRPDMTTKLLLLCDEYTASASEILIEALCDNGRAVSMGKKTVGKNKAQVIL
jgi:carboxyl-terminal processing protease